MHAGFMAMAGEGGVERDLGGREKTSVDEVPYREEMPGVEDRRPLWEMGGDTAAEGDIR